MDMCVRRLTFSFQNAQPILVLYRLHSLILFHIFNHFPISKAKKFTFQLWSNLPCHLLIFIRLFFFKKKKNFWIKCGKKKNNEKTKKVFIRSNGGCAQPLPQGHLNFLFLFYTLHQIKATPPFPSLKRKKKKRGNSRLIVLHHARFSYFSFLLCTSQKVGKQRN